jgi:hypothetical protein
MSVNDDVFGVVIFMDTGHFFRKCYAQYKNSINFVAHFY